MTTNRRDVGSDDEQTTDFSSRTDVAHAVAVQDDGKIVVAGSSTSGGNSDFAIARYNADGSLDTSFGLRKGVTTDLFIFFGLPGCRNVWPKSNSSAVLATQSTSPNGLPRLTLVLIASISGFSIASFTHCPGSAPDASDQA